MSILYAPVDGVLAFFKESGRDTRRGIFQGMGPLIAFPDCPQRTVLSLEPLQLAAGLLRIISIGTSLVLWACSEAQSQWEGVR